MRRGPVYAVSLAVLLGAWVAWAALAARAGGQQVLSPLDVISGVRDLAVQGMPPGHLLAGHVALSLARVLLGFLAAALVGLTLGVLSGSMPIVNGALRPVVDLLKPIPPLAWVPLAIGWLGIGLRAAAFIVFLGAVFPIFVSTCAGVGRVPVAYLEVGRSFRATRLQLWRTVVLPAALPSIVTGLRIGLGVAWMTLVAAELTDVRDGLGLGYMLMSARDLQRMDLVVAGMALIGLLGWLLDAALRLGGRRFTLHRAEA